MARPPSAGAGVEGWEPSAGASDSMPISSGGLDSPGPAEDDRDRAGEDLEVETQRPLVDVLQVERDPVVEAELASAAHLPEAGHPGRGAEPAHEPRLVEELHVAHGHRSRTHERHVA